MCKRSNNKFIKNKIGIKKKVKKGRERVGRRVTIMKK